MQGQYNSMSYAITDLPQGAFPDGRSLVGLPVNIAAAGAAQASAAPLNMTSAQAQAMFIVTGATGNNGVLLPTASIPGAEIVLISSAATNALLVYPPAGGAINYGTVNANQSITARKPVTFIALDTAGNWMANISA